ncbi:PAS domain S-box protein [Desulfolutivibrio sp.]|uniref:PAS domain S-box protein n=1 Tax=Desulfolutivibrio sp. TaxID=2773296 RepID=UPI002F96BB6A
MLKPGNKYVLIIPVLYFMAAGAWILFSDMAVDVLFRDPQSISDMQTSKGWFFVVTTSLLLYALLRRMAAGQRAQVDSLFTARRELAAAGDRLASIINAAPLAIYLLDREGRVSLWNPAAERLFGWKEAEVMGRPLPTVPDNHKTEFLAILARAFSKAPPADLDVVRMRRDGSRLEVSLHAAPIDNGHGVITGVLFMASDVTAARELTRERDRLFNYSVDLLCVSDYAGVLQQVNPAWTRTLGFSRRELVGRPMVELVHPDDLSAFLAMGERLVEGAPVRNFEARYRKKDEAYAWLSFASHPLPEQQRIFSVARDISDRKLAEEELLKRRRFMETVLTSLPIGVSVRLLDTGLATFQNPRYSEILGWPPEALATLDGYFSSLFPDPRERTSLRERMLADVQSGDPGRMSWKDLPITTATGERRHVTIASFPVPGHNVLVATVLDTTFRTLAEMSMAEARKQAEQANQAKTQFLANMSHELRTPLNAIFGMSQLAQTTTLPPDQAECWDITFQSAKKLLSIVDNLIELANMESGAVQLTVKEFDIRSLVDSLCRTHEMQARLKNLDFTWRVADDIGNILVGDPFRLRQILVNLLVNAIRFTMRGGITLTVERYEAPPDGPRRVFVDQGFSGECLLFRIADTGIGIPEDKLASIFDSFSLAEDYLTKRYGGTGLGLSIAKQLTELLGGSVWVESTPGQGSVFSFTAAFWLPACRVSFPGAEPLPEDAADPLRVLLVEDDSSNRLSAATMLRHMGHAVTEAENGQEALRALASDPFDMVLMDIQMPVMDGLTATRHIRHGEIPGPVKNIPIVALTAYAMESDRERFLTAGMDDFLAKPFEMQALADTVGRVMARRKLN